MTRWASNLLFRLRTWRQAQELELALSIRKRDRAKRQAAARKGHETRFNRRSKGNLDAASNR